MAGSATGVSIYVMLERSRKGERIRRVSYQPLDGETPFLIH